MKKLVLFTLSIVFSLSLFAQDPSVDFEQANDLYKKGEYTKALQTYQKINEQGYEEAELYFNIGNSYYKESNFTYAILYYEKALRLDPRNKNIQYNLKLANQYIVDKVEPLPTVLVVRVKNAIITFFNSSQWSMISIMLFFLGMVGLALFVIFGNSSGSKKAGFATAFFGILFAILSYFFAEDQYKAETQHLDAIIIQPSVTVKGAPSDTGTELFILHEGIKVHITDSIQGWKEVRIPDGNTGWVENKTMERI